jgi:hypothetical protein
VAPITECMKKEKFNWGDATDRSFSIINKKYGPYKVLKKINDNACH